MHLHIINSFEFIDEHLPKLYVEKVQAKLAESGNSGISSGVIRNVKNRGVEAFKISKHLPVLTALLEVAKDNKKEIEEFLDASSELQNHGS